MKKNVDRTHKTLFARNSNATAFYLILYWSMGTSLATERLRTRFVCFWRSYYGNDGSHFSRLLATLFEDSLGVEE
jgi:hypothetical protein